MKNIAKISNTCYLLLRKISITSYKKSHIILNLTIFCLFLRSDIALIGHFPKENKIK